MKEAEGFFGLGRGIISVCEGEPKRRKRDWDRDGVMRSLGSQRN